MHGVNEFEKSVLELLNEEPERDLSERQIWQTIFQNKGYKRDVVENSIISLENKQYILRLGKRTRYKLNPASEFKLYPSEFETVLSNMKAVNLIINIYNESFYPSITFEEFHSDHLKRKVARKETSDILKLACSHGFIQDLPLDLRPAKSTINGIKRLGRWYSKLIANIESHPIIKTISILLLFATVVTTIAWFVSPAFKEFLKTIFN